MATPTKDLHNVMYTSLDGDYRKKNLPMLLETYYASFASVLSETKVPMPFSLPGLAKEFQRTIIFGFVMALMVVPTVLLEPKDAPAMDELLGNDNREAVAQHQLKVNAALSKSPNLYSRYLSVFDELNEIGFFKKSLVRKMVASYIEKNF